MSSVLFALALCLPSADAFAPTDDVHIGIEPQRVYQVHPQAQAALYRTKAWRAFAATDGQGWTATWDELSDSPHRMRGPGIDMGSVADESEVEAALVAFFDRHERLFAFEAGTLRTKSINYSAVNDTWYADFDTPRNGLNVYRGALTARVVGGNLVMVGGPTYGNVAIRGDLVVSESQATQRAINRGPVPEAAHYDVSAEAILLPMEEDGLHLRTTWMIRTQTDEPRGIWVSFVDAETGELLNVHNEVRYINGSVMAEHHERTLDGSPLVTSPMPQVPVETTGESVWTDHDGQFEIGADANYVTSLDGEYVTIKDQRNGGDIDAIASDDPDLLWSSADASQAEIDSYVFLHHVQDWGLIYAPEVPMVTRHFRSNVNLSGSCNAFFDGYTVNFLRSGWGCNNTAEIADVNYHEWGHGFHMHSLLAGVYDGSIGEGAADVVAFLQTADNTIAPYFYEDGWGIRDVEPNQVYPHDYVSSDEYVHSNGLIFGGAMWDLWHMLEDIEGEEVAYDSINRIFTGLLKGGPTIPESYDEAILADDDDGDLSNGTPHECEIIDAFGAHGLGPLGNGTVFISGHEPLGLQLPNIEAEVQLNMVSSSPNCFSYEPETATVVYRVDGGDWESITGSVAGDQVTGLIPGQEEGAFVEYYIEIDDASAGTVTAPAGAFINPYSYYVGGVIEIDCHDFEANDGGFTHQLVSGEDQEGADDWQWGTPAGAAGDPTEAASGVRIWGNDLGDGEFNGEYQHDKHNALMSPEYNTKHYRGVFLHYNRWLTVEDGFYDQARIVADGKVVWTNWATTQSVGDEHHEDQQWVPHSVDLGEMGDDGDLSVAWEIVSDGGLALGGWNVDDVCVYAPATTDNKMGISDFLATNNDDQVRLSWTNPIHEPVERVVVVRRGDRYPESVSDGVPVYDKLEPVPGGEVTAFDIPFGEDGDTYYAVYAYDGDGWLSWTIEGWNADYADVDGDAVADAFAGSESGGCGCATTTSPVSGMIPLLGLLALARRRRE